MKEKRENPIKEVVTDMMAARRAVVIAPTGKEQTVRRSNMKKILMTMGILVLAFGLSACGKSIDVSEYMTYSVTGYDGYGQVESTFDAGSFESAVLKAVGVKDVETNDAKVLKGFEAVYLADTAVSGEWDQEKGLSNGDTIHYTWNIVEDALKDYHITLKAKDITLEVKDLQELTSYDPFEELEVTFSGYDTVGTMQASTDNVSAEGISFQADRQENLTNGDTVTISIQDAESKKEALAEQGYDLAETEKTYTVTGLTELKDYDPFEQCTLTFTGASPYAKAEIQDAEPYDAISFAIDKKSGIKKGDTVTVSLSGDMDTLAQQAAKVGKRITATEKQFTADDISEYVTDAASLTAEQMEGLDQYIQPLYKQNVGTYTYPRRDSFVSMEMVGWAMRSWSMPEDSNYSGDNAFNVLFVLYKINVTNENGQAFTFYNYAQVPNAVIKADGSLSYDVDGYKFNMSSSNKVTSVGGGYFTALFSSARLDVTPGFSEIGVMTNYLDKTSDYRPDVYTEFLK